MARYFGFLPYNGSNNYGFVSYKSEEDKAVTPFVSSFNRAGINLWYDDGIPLGRPWDEVISDRITNSSFLVVFVTNNIFNSVEIKKELSVAKRCSVPIVPIFLEKITYVPQNQQMFYQDIVGLQGIEAYNRSVEEVTTELFRKLSRLNLVFSHNLNNSPYGNQALSDVTPSFIRHDINQFPIITRKLIITVSIIVVVTFACLIFLLSKLDFTGSTKINENSNSDICYLGIDIKAYDHGIYYEVYDGKNEFYLGGVGYKKGFTLGSYPAGGYAIFNLDGKYNCLSALVGNIDNVNYSFSYVVYGDGNIIGTIDIVGGGLPIDVTFDVSGIKQLKIVADGKMNYGEAVGFANILVSKQNIESSAISLNTDNGVYLGKAIKAYQHGSYYKECDDDGEYVEIQGSKFYNGFKIGTYTTGAYASYNLNGEFSKLTGKVGFAEKVYPIKFTIYGDNIVIGEIELNSTQIQSFECDVSDIKQLTIVADGKMNYGYAVSFADVFVSK